MRRWNRQLIIVVALLMWVPGVARAQFEQSTSYSMNESQIGGNGLFNSTSGHYSINPTTDDGGESLGQSTSGNSSSASYQTNSGFDTTAQPGLMMTVNSSTINLIPSPMTTSAGSFGVATFDIRDYTSSGYVVKAIGSTPAYHGHNLTALATDTASSPGTEQFGINTVLNPTDGWGSNPVCQAVGFCYSTNVAGDGVTGTYGTTRPYTIPGEYRFNSGETIASGPKSSGDVTFTVTFMSNMSTLSPAGQYSGGVTLVATGSF